MKLIKLSRKFKKSDSCGLGKRDQISEQYIHDVWIGGGGGCDTVSPKSVKAQHKTKNIIHKTMAQFFYGFSSQFS